MPLQVAIADIAPEGWRHSGELPAAVADRVAQSLALPGRAIGGHCTIVLQPPAPVLPGSRGNGRIDVAGTLDLAGVVPCSKCLAPAHIALQVPLEVALVPVASEPAPLLGGELTADAVELYTYEGEEVALEKMLHDEIILALPARALCQEGCRGLCEGCGCNLNELAQPHACGAKRAGGPLAALAHYRPRTPSKQEK